MELSKFVDQRQTLLEGGRTLHNAIWTDIAEHLLLLREDLLGTYQAGQRYGTKQYDGSPTGALQLFTDGWHGHLVSPSMEWFKYRMQNDDINEIPEIRGWLQACEKHVYGRLQDSNFYSAIRQFIQDGGGIGTAYMFIEEDIEDDRLVFIIAHPGECYISQNHYGDIDILHRKFKYSSRQLVKKFGLNKLPDKIKLIYDNNPFTQYDVIHAIFPRDDRNPASINSKNKRFASVWKLKDENSILRESGFEKFPPIVWRYSLSGKSPYGYSPAMDALADIVSLNLISKDLLQASELAVKPPYMIPAELKGKTRLKPNGLNYYSDPKQEIKPIRDAIDFPIGLDREERKQQIIERHFRVDFFMMLNSSEKAMTATEIMERQSEKAILLGPAVGRFSSEALNKVHELVFDIETRSGRLPEPPRALASYAGEKIDIVYMGVLAQAQRRLSKSSGIFRFLESARPIVEMFPDAADNIEYDETIRELMESSDMPIKTIRKKDEVKQLRDARAQVAEEEAMKEDLERAVQGAKTLGDANKAFDGKLAEEQLGGIVPQ